MKGHRLIRRRNKVDRPEAGCRKLDVSGVDNRARGMMIIRNQVDRLEEGSWVPEVFGAENRVRGMMIIRNQVDR
ncbi:hypothetical protein [uncultured Chryseobacterium sp.]|uniref:hypothetical protein n=1 Tax=uncultured Chryseobacterium sp. TaxID=259322 RepID=UPI0025E0BDA5|nr:hypothetical protein [uncultured Chryseobacterium sp.]